MYTPPHGLKRVYNYRITMVKCMSVYCTDLYAYYGIQSNLYNQHNTQHTESNGCVKMHVFMPLAFKETMC